MPSGNSWTQDEQVPHVCAVCGERITLTDSSWSGTRADGRRFLLCKPHMRFYGNVFRSEATPAH